MNERISIRATYNNGTTKNFDWYNAAVSADEVFETERELADYVLESIANDDRVQDAIRIEADDLLTDNGKVVNRLSVTVRSDTAE